MKPYKIIDFCVKIIVVIVMDCQCVDLCELLEDTRGDFPFIYAGNLVAEG